MRSLGNFLKRLSLNFYSKESKAKTSQFSSDSCSDQKCVWGEGKKYGEWNLCWETAQLCTQSIIVCKLELGTGNMNPGAIRCSFLANTLGFVQLCCQWMYLQLLIGVIVVGQKKVKKTHWCGQGIQDFQVQTKISYPKSAFKIEGNSGEFRLTLPVAVLSLCLGAAANSTTTHF